MMDRKWSCGADEMLLPGAETQSAGCLEGDEILRKAHREGNRLVIPAGLYDLNSDLYLDIPGVIYDFSGATVKSSEGYEIRVTASDASVMNLHAFASFYAEEEADRLVVTRCRLCGGAKFYPVDLMLENNVFDAPVEVYAENAVVRNNDFDDAPLELFDSANGFVAFNRMVISPVTISYGRNDVFFANEFQDSGEVSLTANACFYLTVAENCFDGEYALEKCVNTLVNGNKGKLHICEGEHNYGSDVPYELPEFGANEASLPPVGYKRFIGVPRRDGMRVLREDGSVAEIPIKEVIRAGAGDGQVLVLLPGAYRVPAEERVHLYLENLHDFTLYAYGVLFECEDYRKTAVALSGCSGVTMRGFSIDHTLPANTQGRILAVHDDYALWKADDGFPDHIVGGEWISDAGFGEGFRKGSDRPYRDFYGVRRESTKDGILLRFPHGHDLLPGDKVMFRGLFAHVNYYENCENTLVEDVTLYNGSGFGFMEHGGNGGTILRRVLLTPGAPPEGTERLISVCDATHSTCMRRGIRVYDSLFEKMTDDATNVNGTYGDITGVKAVEGDTEVYYGTGTSNFATVCYDFQPGDRVLAYTKAGKLLYDGTAVEATKNEDGRKSVRVKGALRPEGDAVIQNSSANGAGFAFENSLFRNNRSRGLLIKACKGIIRHCTLADNGMSAILVKAEIEDGWGECGFSEDLLIEDNLILRSGYYTGSELHSPINISGDGQPNPDPAAHNQKRITVRHNRIADRYTQYAITVNMAKDIVVEDNDILPRVGEYKNFNPPEVNSLAPQDDDVTPIHLICVEDVAVKNNSMPPSAKAAYEIG